MKYLLLTLCLALSSYGQTLDVRQALKGIAEKFANPQQYSFKGDLYLEQKPESGGPGRLLGKSEVALAVAPGGKFRLEIRPMEGSAYLLVSNGQKNWAYVEKLKQYTEEEGGAVIGLDDDDVAGTGADDHEITEEFAKHVVHSIGRLLDRAESASLLPPVQVKYEGNKEKWPGLQVISKPDARGLRQATALIVDPATLNIGRAVFATLAGRDSNVITFRMTVEFEYLRLADPPSAAFQFEPPKNAKLVDSVPIPGQTGSFLLNKPAPDFDLEMLDGKRVRLSDFRGKPVLLNFWASWCGPCRRELPLITKLHRELEGKGLVVLGLNDELKSTARKFANENGLSFPTLYDAGAKVSRSYRVKAIPSAFLIDAEGKVVRFVRGSRDEASLRSLLKSVGL